MKKLFFVLFLCIASSIYAMDDEKALLRSASKGFKKSLTTQKLNIAFRKAVENASQNRSQKAFKEIENYLNLGADINSKIGNLGETALILAVENLNKNLFDFLLKKSADINSCDYLERTPLYIILISQKEALIANFDIEKDFLKRGANINAKKNGNTLLYTAMQSNAIESIKPLIKYGVDVNEKYTFQWTPLRYVIQNRNFAAIKELCNLGASLMNIDFNNSNAFHAAIEDKLPKNYINLLITNSHFDSYNNEIDKQLEKKVITAYLALEQSKIFPPEVQIIILSHLALDYLHGFNKQFCRWLVKKGKDPLLIHAHRSANYLEQILQSTDNDNKTAFQVLHEYQGDAYIQEVEPLVDVKKLQKDRIDFINGTTQGDNLVAQIYEQSKKLLLES